jgi:hypothetical protein
MKVSGTNSWVYPRKDPTGQWWYENQPVDLVVLPQSDKESYLKSMGVQPKSTPKTTKT